MCFRPADRNVTQVIQVASQVHVNQTKAKGVCLKVAGSHAHKAENAQPLSHWQMTFHFPFFFFNKTANHGESEHHYTNNKESYLLFVFLLSLFLFLG